jgi:DNA-binding transcriptional LysR family regulator
LPRKIDWENQIGRRLKLRDLHVFFTVVQRGSMAKAAAQLGVSQPSISESIAGLERALGVPLFERNPRGVEPTAYGDALLKRGTTVFSELKDAVREIEFLSDPTEGELRIGCAESVSTGFLPPIIDRFSQQHPGFTVHVSNSVSPTLELPELRARKIDFFISRLVKPLAREADDLTVETLFDDQMVLAAGAHSRWTQRRRIKLADLVDEPWLLNPPQSWNYITVAEAFRMRGLAMPKIRLMTFSIHLRASLLASGPYITGFPGTFLQSNGDRYGIRPLPVDLPERPWPVAIVTLKSRILHPVAGLFIASLRDYAARRALAGAAPARERGEAETVF